MFTVRITITPGIIILVGLYFSSYDQYLLTEVEVRTGKYLPEVFI